MSKEPSSPNTEGASPQAANAGAAAGAQRPAPTVASILGEICWLYANLPGHRHYFIADLEWLVMPAIVNQQFRIYRDGEGRPVGIVLWAKVDAEADKRLTEGHSRLRPDEWTGGDTVWIMDIADLSGGQRRQGILDDVKKVIFADTPIKYIETEASGARQVRTI